MQTIATNATLRRAALLLSALALGYGCSTSPTPQDATADIREAGMDASDVPDVPARCTSNASCATQLGRPMCDPTSGACVSCTSNASLCTASQYCNPATGACATGCSRDEGCAMSGGDGGVADGGVATGRCDTVTHMCVQCVTDDHCPAGNLCRGSVCVQGCSATRACPSGQSCCDGACINTQTNTAACGACGNTCRIANGTASCTNGTCGVATCADGYRDCDMNAMNGCEVNLQTDPANCGTCGMRCTSGTGSTGTCSAGRCGIACAAGVGDCDMDPSNGCETDTTTSLMHCGMCGRTCNPPNGTGSCAMGACTIGMCNAGFANCDMDLGNGCETNTNSNVFACGMCGRACNLPNVNAHTCTMGTCGIMSCDPGFADCDMNPSNGCETNTDTSSGNCGACGRSCGMGSCTRGFCTSTCSGGLGDCDGNVTNGCEANLNTDTANCGGCRNSCVAGPQSTARCTSGVCSITCSASFADCNMRADDGCEIDTRVSTANCGGCGRACPSGQVCNDSMCVMPCPGVQTRCSGTCVSLFTDNTNCGACGRVCPSGSTCQDGVCRCPLGGSSTGGVSCGSACVDVLSDNNNCGTCGTVCASGSTCTRGVCRCSVGGVPIGVVCGSTCVDPFSDRNNCGGCGRACPTGNTCSVGVCRCPTGGITCSGVCIDAQSDPANCGSCGRTCAAGESCVGGSCINFGSGTFRIESLGTTGCRLIEHNAVTGDDRGGIAVSRTNVFYTGDSATGRFALADVSGGASIGRQYDALVTELSTGTVFTLGSSATTPIPNGGGTVTHLIQIDGSTGALTTTAIALSRSIPVSSDTGIFGGSGRIAIVSGGQSYHVLVPSGTVAALGTTPTLANHVTCESWAFWGIAEFFGGSLYVDYTIYVGGSYPSTQIVRTRLPDGMTTTLATFAAPGLSDMCSFTFSTVNNRWYWHHEGGSMFGGSDESVGFCDGRFSTP